MAQKMAGNGDGLEGGTPIRVPNEYVLAPDQLLPGDVLIHRPRKPSLISKKISTATSSPYTHAAIFLGEGMIADSNPPKGVAVRRLEDLMGDANCVAVLRTQLGFGSERVKKLNEFVAAVVKEAKLYNVAAVLNFRHDSEEYFSGQLEFIRENYGKADTAENYSKQSFFCSAFVIACFAAVGVIDASAQVGYQPSFFSPGHLYQDPTLGWLAGFLVPEGGAVGMDDPAFVSTTHWVDAPEMRWW